MKIHTGDWLSHNPAVFTLSRSRPLIFLAVFAWLAQLCLPVAHAAVMAQTDAGLASWCGARSPGMAEKLAQLPAEVREILDEGMAQAGQHQDCAQLCSASAGAGAPLGVVVGLRAAGLERELLPSLAPALRDRSAPPPARGPPALS